MKRIFLIPLLFFLSFAAAKGQTFNDSLDVIKLDDGWKFKTGDKTEYANPDFYDSKWKNIKVDKPWQKYGYPNYHGYA